MNEGNKQREMKGNWQKRRQREEETKRKRKQREIENKEKYIKVNR